MSISTARTLDGRREIEHNQNTDGGPRRRHRRNEGNRNMSHEVETMAFANEVPWHGLGNRVDAKASVDDMLVAAGLDWTVRLHPCHATVREGVTVRVPNKSVLVRDLDDKVLTVASDNWKPVQNREVLEFFREYAEAGGATLETAGSLRGGRTVWGLANLGHSFAVGGGRDAVRGYVLFASHHEVGKASLVKATAVRVVCANTMGMALRGGATAGMPVYRQNHLTDFDAAKAKETLGLAHEAMARTELNAKALEQLRLSEFDTVRVLAKHFQPVTLAGDDLQLITTKAGGIGAEVKDARVQQLLDDANARSARLHEVMLANHKAPGAVPGTGWGVLNAVTYWADHLAGRSADARLSKAWFGETADLKVAVERDLLEMVG